MISFDTNILFAALESSHAQHAEARAFLNTLPSQGEVAVCELVLVETYVLLRNPAVMKKPMTGAEAAGLIGVLRANPEWRLIDYPGGLMNRVWKTAASKDFSRRRIFDVRLAATLVAHGVDQFATRNDKDFRGLGLRRVWDPLKA